MNITLFGRIPSKKNSKRIICRGNFPKVLPSKEYERWHNEQMWQIKKYKPKTPIDYCEIYISFYFPDRRKCDLSNKAESVLDFLVDAGIIKDDSWQIVDNLFLYSCGVDSKKPRAEIEIVEL